jgi:hypothetical protein
MEVKKLLLQIREQLSTAENYHMDANLYQKLKAETGDQVNKEVFRYLSEKHASITRNKLLVDDILYYLNHELKIASGKVTDFEIDGKTLKAKVDLSSHNFLETPTILASVTADQIDASYISVVVYEPSATEFKALLTFFVKGIVIDKMYLNREHVTLNWIAVEGVSDRKVTHGVSKAWIQGKASYTPIQLPFEPMVFVANQIRANESRGLGICYVRPKYKKDLFSAITKEPKDSLLRDKSTIHYFAMSSLMTDKVVAGYVPYATSTWKIVPDGESEAHESARTLMYEMEYSHPTLDVKYDDSVIDPINSVDFVYPTVPTVGVVKVPTVVPPELKIPAHIFDVHEPGVSPYLFNIPANTIPEHLLTPSMHIPVEQAIPKMVIPADIDPALIPRELIEEIPVSVPVKTEIVQRDITFDAAAKIIEETTKPVQAAKVEKTTIIEPKTQESIKLETMKQGPTKLEFIFKQQADERMNFAVKEQDVPSVVNRWIWTGSRWAKLGEAEEKCFKNGKEVKCCTAMIEGKTVRVPCNECGSCDANQCTTNKFCQQNCAKECKEKLCESCSKNGCKGEFCQLKCPCGKVFTCEKNCGTVKDCIFNKECREKCGNTCPVKICARCKETGCKSEFCHKACPNVCTPNVCEECKKNGCSDFICKLCPDCPVDCKTCENSITCLINTHCAKCNCSTAEFCKKCELYDCPHEKCHQLCQKECDLCNKCEKSYCRYPICFEKCKKQCPSIDCEKDCQGPKCVNEPNCRSCKNCAELVFCDDCAKSNCKDPQCFEKCKTQCPSMDCVKDCPREKCFTDANCKLCSHCKEIIYCEQCKINNCVNATCFDRCPKICISLDCQADCPAHKCLTSPNCMKCSHCQEIKFCDECSKSNCQQAGCFDRCLTQCPTLDCVTSCPPEKCYTDPLCKLCKHCDHVSFCEECKKTDCKNPDCFTNCTGSGACNAFCEKCAYTYANTYTINPELCSKCENIPITCERFCRDKDACNTKFCAEKCREKCAMVYETATIRVDLKPYKFTQVPTIIPTIVYTSVDGVQKRSEFLGSSSIYELSKEGFTMTVHGIPQGETPKLSLHWIAINSK